MRTGRPTKYSNELLDNANDYLEDWDADGDAIPSHAALALRLGVTRKTIYIWAKEDGKEEFCDILERLMQLQEKELINKGLTGKFNSAITKLVLGKHNYSEKKEVTNKGALPVSTIREVVKFNKGKE